MRDEGNEPRAARIAGIVGSFGGMVFFGCLVAFGEVRDSPQWLVWPGGIAMWIGVPLSLVLTWRAGRRCR